jgi:RNA polymerase sigma-70 factor (ECF subfamily)
LTPEADPRSDADLVARARAGDDDAFGRLVQRYARAALAVARGVVGDVDLAEDVCQDALFRVWQRLGDCREPDRFAAWLARAVRRHALNAIRGRRTAPMSEAAEVAASAAPPDRAAEAAELGRRLDRALERLTAEQRTAVLLFDLEGWPHARIAEALDTTEAMSRQHLMLARRRIRELLGSREEGA